MTGAHSQMRNRLERHGSPAAFLQENVPARPNANGTNRNAARCGTSILRRIRLVCTALSPVLGSLNNVHLCRHMHDHGDHGDH